MMKIFLPLLLVVAISCKNSESSKSPSISADEIISTQLGEKYERKDQGDYSLCYTVTKSTSKRTTALVVNIKTGKIVYGPEKLNADIEWDSDTMLKIKEYPEVIVDKTSTDTYTYYYDIIQQKKVSNKL